MLNMQASNVTRVTRAGRGCGGAPATLPPRAAAHQVANVDCQLLEIRPERETRTLLSVEGAQYCACPPSAAPRGPACPGTGPLEARAK